MVFRFNDSTIQQLNYRHLFLLTFLFLLNTVCKQHITDLPLDELKRVLEKMGQPSYRFDQLLYWLYKRRVDSYDAMTNVPKTARCLLQEKFDIGKLPITSILKSKNDDAVKFGFEVGEGKDIIESVLLYDGKRRSLCVSSQLGCALGCVFCETGAMGFKRDLTQHEILGQVIVANDYLAAQSDRLVSNIVFMGMGEALANFNTFFSSVTILMNEHCFSIGGRKITVSTAGVVPYIEKLIESDLNVSLAVSLNTYNNDKRNVLMPINKRYPIEDLVKASVSFHRQTGRKLTFEYVLIAGENDTHEAVSVLAKLLEGIPCKFNIISLNNYTNAELHSPSTEELNRFAARLADKGIAVTVRKSRGSDISGACGQLAGKIKKGEV